MRRAPDIFKTKEGKLITIPPFTEIPKGTKLWQGYDYKRQEWIYEGIKNNRTLEELKG